MKEPVIKWERQAIDYDAIKAKILSYSSLKEFRKSPEHFLEYMFGEKKTTAALEFGTLVDKMILTPDAWKEDFIVKPKFDMRTNVGKAEFEKFAKENNGKSFVTQEEMDTAILIHNRAWNNRASKELLLKITQTQNYFEFTDKKTGLKMRGFKDGTGEGFIMDLKTTVSADPDEFIRSAINYDYPLQTGVYLEAEKVLNYSFPEYFFLCVEKTAPYGISVLKASDDFVRLGKQQLRQTLDSFRWCLDNCMFNESYEYRSNQGLVDAGLTAGWHSLELPGYVKHKLTDDN